MIRFYIFKYLQLSKSVIFIKSYEVNTKLKFKSEILFSITNHSVINDNF